MNEDHPIEGAYPEDVVIEDQDETVDGLPVLAEEARPLERSSPVSLPAIQTAAVAATGFVAGVATVALVRRRSARKVAPSGRAGARRAVEVLPVVASRTFLIDVHLLAKPSE